MMALKFDACDIGTGPTIDAITGAVWDAELVMKFAASSLWLETSAEVARSLAPSLASEDCS